MDNGALCRPLAYRSCHDALRTGACSAAFEKELQMVRLAYESDAKRGRTCSALDDTRGANTSHILT